VLLLAVRIYITFIVYNMLISSLTYLCDQNDVGREIEDVEFICTHGTSSKPTSPAPLSPPCWFTLSIQTSIWLCYDLRCCRLRGGTTMPLIPSLYLFILKARNKGATFPALNRQWGKRGLQFSVCVCECNIGLTVHAHRVSSIPGRR